MAHVFHKTDVWDFSWKTCQALTGTGMPFRDKGGDSSVASNCAFTSRHVSSFTSRRKLPFGRGIPRSVRSTLSSRAARFTVAPITVSITTAERGARSAGKVTRRRSSQWVAFMPG